MEKILLICNESKTVLNFRKELILFLLEKGFEVEVTVGDTEYLQEINKLGVRTYLVPFKNRSVNPFASIQLKRRFKKVISQARPSIVFTFQLKPNIFGGTAAAAFPGIRVFNMVEGLGDPFQPHDFKGRVIRWIVSKLYKRSFKRSETVFFLNNSDRDEMVAREIVDLKKCIVIPGIGIDTSLYHPKYDLPREIHVVYLARLIKNKGIFDFCDIARATRKIKSDIYFDLYGSESDIKEADLKAYTDEGSVIYHGYVSDVKTVIANSYLLLSTSFREGFPRIILEAMALGRPVVATNVIGNKDVVKDGVTGYLLEKGSIDAFSKRIISLVEDKSQIIELGKHARDYCVEHYDSNIINGIVLNILTKRG